MSDLTETRDPRSRPRISRQQVLILLGLALVNLCLYGGIWLSSQRSTPVRRPPALMAVEPLELRAAYEQAQALALAWQLDAQLSGVTTSWQLSSGDQLTMHRPAWSFSFYSPGARQVQVVAVDQRGAQAALQGPVDVAPQHVEPDWNLDSQDLLVTFLSYGGEAFLSAHPRANIHLQLKGEGAGRSIWYVTAVDPVARQTVIVGVDARSRQVVLTKTSNGGG